MTEITLSKKEIRNRLNSMRIKPEGFNQRHYGVSVKHFNGEETIPNKRIDYELFVDLNVQYNRGELIIDKRNIYYNQHEPDLINEIIANSISKSLYPIRTEINEKGLCTNEVLNHKDVLKRWKEQKEKISEKYVSPSLSDFFQVVDDKFENKEQLERSLHYDWFWNLFFHPKLINYGEKRTVERDLYLAILPYKNPIRFTGIQKIEKIPTYYHSFLVEFESNEQKAPDYFAPKNHQETVPLLMKLKVFFDMDLYHHFPMHTRAYFEVYTKDRFENKTIIKRIEFSQYQQNTEEFQDKQLSLDSPFITGGLVKLPPNKWGFDNFENLENDW